LPVVAAFNRDVTLHFAYLAVDFIPLCPDPDSPSRLLAVTAVAGFCSCPIWLRCRLTVGQLLLYIVAATPTHRWLVVALRGYSVVVGYPTAAFSPTFTHRYGVVSPLAAPIRVC